MKTITSYKDNDILDPYGVYNIPQSPPNVPSSDSIEGPTIKLPQDGPNDISSRRFLLNIMQ